MILQSKQILLRGQPRACPPYAGPQHCKAPHAAWVAQTLVRPSPPRRPGRMGSARAPWSLTIQSGLGGCYEVSYVPAERVVSVYFAESKIKTLAPSLTRRRSRKLEPTQLKPAQPPTASHCHLPQPAGGAGAVHCFPLPSCPAARRQGTPPTASSHLGPHSSPSGRRCLLVGGTVQAAGKRRVRDPGCPRMMWG